MGWFSDNQNIDGATTSAELQQPIERPGIFETFVRRHLMGDSPLTSWEATEKARQLKLDQLQRNEAAPMYAQAEKLRIMAAQDPETIGSTEGLQDFAARPEFWLAPQKYWAETVDMGADPEGNPLSAVRKQYTLADFSSDGATPGKKPATSTGNNPYIAQGLQAFASSNQNQADMLAAMNGDRSAASRIAMQEKLSQQLHQSAQGLDQISNVDKRDGEQAQTDAASTDLKQFQKAVAGLNSGTTRPYEQAGPFKNPLDRFVSMPVDQDPQGRTMVRTDTGNLMPFEELSGRVQQAYADNPNVPREVVKNLLDDFRLQYENSGKTSTGNVGRTTFQKWDPALGKPIITKEDVQPAPTRISVNNGSAGSPINIKDWSDGIVAGMYTIKDVPARGTVRNAVVSQIRKDYPSADLVAIGAGKKFKESAPAVQTLSLVDATKGIMDDMTKAYGELGRSGSPTYNSFQDKYQEYAPEIINDKMAPRAAFMSLKNYGVQEVEKTLSGGGAMSDHRIRLAFENLKNSSTYASFVAATKGLQKVMGERDRATRNGPHPNAPIPYTETRTVSPANDLKSAAAAELARRQGAH